MGITENLAQADTDVPASRIPTESEWLVDIIRQLCDANAKQTQRLETMLDRVNITLETLKQKPETADKMTTFWTAYEKLADEFDKELQKKYGNDLDTSLIFAGLFSAVSSAFMIQIQPELHPDPNPATQTSLLLLLVQNVTGAAVPGIQMAELARPTTIIVVAQSFLYFSLFSTLLAALLAVLGKQWLLHYDLVGKKGTIAERGLERQRKLDGLRHWKFDPVMQILPLLLQLSLLLFAVGLAFYLWTINTVIATMVVVLTFGGFILYSLMVISSLVSPDSPFQTSLGVLLRVLAQKITLPQSLQRLCNLSRSTLTPVLPLRSFLSKTPSANSPPPGLPQFSLPKNTHLLNSVVAPIFDQIPEPSQEVSAIIWALETSTDPQLAESAAAIVPDLQWPINLTLHSSLRRLADLFQGCFDGWKVRDGMDERAIRCIKAFGVLEIVSEQYPQDPIDLLTFDPNLVTSRNDQLTSLVRFFRVSNFPKFTLSAPVITQWSLVFISAQEKDFENLETVIKHFQPNEMLLQNPQLCADFLFCVNSFFSPTTRSDICRRDKSDYCSRLMELLFKNLAEHLIAATPLDPQMVHSIVNKVSQFPISMHNVGQNGRCRDAVYHFCAVPGLEYGTITSALQNVHMPLSWLQMNKPGVTQKSLGNVEWVYTMLENSRSQPKAVDTVGDLLQVLFLCKSVQGGVTRSSLETILWAISPDVNHTEDSIHRMKFLAFHALCSARPWFDDNELGPVLRAQPVWEHLGVFCMQTSSPTSVAYIALGDQLSQKQEWKSVISEDLSTWLRLLPRLFGVYADEATRQTYCSVLARLWPADEPGCERFGKEKPLAMAFTVLANVWDEFDFSNPTTIHQGIQLAECSVWTSFCARIVGPTGYEKIHEPSQEFKDIIMDRLATAIESALQRAKQVAVHVATVQLLSKLMNTIRGELTRGHPNLHNAGDGEEIKYWQDLCVDHVIV